MDELTIGDKIYISSKQAAKITGYAKDYVGQLCREGRVNARLVGRNWYVLESSIREHRFGPESKPHAGTEAAVEPVTSPVSSWEPPTYEAAEEVNLLPPIEASKTPLTNPDTTEAVVLMQDAWKEWFAAREAARPVETEVLSQEPIVLNEREEESIEEDFGPIRISDIPNDEAVFEVSREREEEESIPVTRVHERDVIEEYEPIIEDTELIAPTRMHSEPRMAGSVIDLSHTYQKTYAPTAPSRNMPGRRKVRTRGRLTIQATLISFAGLVAIMAIIGSGALDTMLAQQGIDNNLRGAIFDAVRGESNVKK